METIDKNYNDFSVGDFVNFTRNFTISDFENFSLLSGDKNPLHHNEDYAAISKFGKIIIPVYLLASPLSTIAGMIFPGHRSLILNTNFKALKPAFYNRTIHYSGKVVSKNDSKSVLTIRVIAIDNLEILLEAELNVQVRDDLRKDKWKENQFFEVKKESDILTVLITGAAGEIAREVAKKLAIKGYQLILQCRTMSQSILKVKEECERLGVSAKIVVADLANPLERFQLLEQLKQVSNVTAFVHAASPRLDSSFLDLVEVNFLSLKDISNCIIPSMLNVQKGKIIFIGSSSLQYLPDNWEYYTAAKAAGQTWINSIHKKYSKYGIDAFTLAPGFVQTSFSTAYRDSNTVDLIPEEVAESVVNLISDQIDVQGNYLWLETGFLKTGTYGFYENVSSAQKSNVDYSQKDLKFSSSIDDSSINVLLSEFFKTPAGYDIEQGGLNITPGWDSLKHIELLLFLESRLGIKFTSGEVDKTTRTFALKELVNAKRK
ncbi:SDR family NAD(P)-dependent oxidoreductase [Leptospira santarosai]|uniref:SDR family NAD(P)-dependent oxidoreductase n=1 Tax=Leptospira santarosai TaxID=28183 RepID=UPI0002BD4C40|nr:SDR family NAD(P)-dependent oxidoreductase [Leptospira santarosai]EMO15849.1 NADH(P)-binding protein, PF13460 family [Leptospira santarosai str. CBC523]EMO32811.1 NADH(P)-binding protein, PF13460 family [Leptospira santarosai str. HAI821]EPG82474.1 NADH(P)-binding protein, PF13460 family [Leptospira santarosai serovar Shermani str. 1342KT]MDI7207018.1 SDR family NAD(P)-dependent oxidoreductase [Leptospira santarosai]MDI7215507.1 SDR family NAD(P)-dependent oxidoreductase [Leptospira santaro